MELKPVEAVQREMIAALALRVAKQAEAIAHNASKLADAGNINETYTQIGRSQGYEEVARQIGLLVKSL